MELHGQRHYIKLAPNERHYNLVYSAKKMFELIIIKAPENSTCNAYGIQSMMENVTIASKRMLKKNIIKNMIIY